MKKSTIILMVFVLLWGIATSVLGASFSELNMQIELSEEYYDLKSGIDNNDSKITYYEAMLKTTKEQLKEQFKTNHILYYAKNTNLSKTLSISQTENLSTKKYSIYI